MMSLGGHRSSFLQLMMREILLKIPWKQDMVSILFYSVYSYTSRGTKSLLWCNVVIFFRKKGPLQWFKVSVIYALIRNGFTCLQISFVSYYIRVILGQFTPKKGLYTLKWLIG